MKKFCKAVDVIYKITMTGYLLIYGTLAVQSYRDVHSYLKKDNNEKN